MLWLCLHLIPVPQPQEAMALVILWVPRPGIFKICLWNHTANALGEMGRKAHRRESLPDVQDPCSSSTAAGKPTVVPGCCITLRVHGAFLSFFPSRLASSAILVWFSFCYFLSVTNPICPLPGTHTHRVLPALLHTTGMTHCAERNPCWSMSGRLHREGKLHKYELQITMINSSARQNPDSHHALGLHRWQG